MTMLGMRIIAPAMMSQQQFQLQQQQMKSSTSPVTHFSGSDVKNINCAPKISNSSSVNNITKRVNYNNPSSQYTTGPLPSIERRNARERNRVKQVNNGFDKLRLFISSKVVDLDTSGRGVNKKLSKVDTLQFAVKYIQRLKDMLDENNSRLPQTSEIKVIASSSMSITSSYISASPAPSHHHPMHVTYASTPMSYQENHNQPNFSEPSVSPAPSYHSDYSSMHQEHQVYTMPNAQFIASTVKTEEGSYPQAAYSQMQFIDEDSGSIEEDGILDDILHWQQLET